MRLAYLFNPAAGGRDTLVEILAEGVDHRRELCQIRAVGTGDALTVTRYALTWITAPAFSDQEWETAHIIDRALDHYEGRPGTLNATVDWMLEGTTPGTQRRNRS